VSEGTDRSGNGNAGNLDVNAAEKSDRLIVPEKATNEAKAKESLEGRGRTKENILRSHVVPTLCGVATVWNWGVSGRVHPRLAGNYLRWEPYAGKPLVRICPGGAS
jgi:hypothetical protein